LRRWQLRRFEVALFGSSRVWAVRAVRCRRRCRRLAPRALGQFAPYGSSRSQAVRAVGQFAPFGERAPFQQSAPFVHRAVSAFAPLGSSRPLRAPARAVSAVRAVSVCLFPTSHGTVE